jgi:ABC-2 type transport system permease protein/lipopolysaccharide transport system permease protein
LGVALRDISAGLWRRHVWGLLGWQDIRQRYRRSQLGAFWITLSMGIMVASLGVLYAALFRIEVSDYLPFLTLGFIIWGLISGLVTDGCTVFITSEGIIKQVDLPLSVHVYRTLWRNLIIFAHNLVIFVIVALLFAVWPGIVGLWALPGLALLCLNGVWLVIILGLVSARFRDLPQIVASVLQVAFFVTPIIWKPELIPGPSPVLYLNPFFHFIELVRAPLLGEVPPLVSWLAVIGISAVGWAAMLVVFSQYRRRIAYWV